MGKLSEYFNYLLEQGSTFIPATYNAKPYLAEYFENSEILDLQASTNYGNLQMLNEDNIVTQKLIQASITCNDYKWNTLFNTTVLEYDPIWNVDGKTVITTEYGGQTTTKNNGQRKETTVNGANTVTENQKLSAYPFDTGAKTATEETDNTIENPEKTDTRTQDATSDTETTQAHTDKVTEERQGNIGVTSTQSLIEQERKVAVFNFLQSVLLDIITDITVPVWEEEESEVAYEYRILY